jgi:hypothetical protein
VCGIKRELTYLIENKLFTVTGEKRLLARAMHFHDCEALAMAGIRIMGRTSAAQTARGQRLITLSYLLPQVSAGLLETVGQTSLATFGVKSSPCVPNILGPRAYGKVHASLRQRLFSLESIQRFRSVFSLLPPENATGNYVKVVQ